MKKFGALFLVLCSVVVAQPGNNQGVSDRVPERNPNQGQMIMQEKLNDAMQQATPYIQRAQKQADEYFRLRTDQQKSRHLEERRIAAEAQLNKAIDVLNNHGVEVALQAQEVRERFNSKLQELRQIQERLRLIH